MMQDELLKMIRQKDENAFGLMYDMYARSLFAIIFNLVRERSEAEEVLQETFVKIWKNAGKYKESKGRLYTWMVKTARSLALERVKAKGNSDIQKNFSAENFIHLHDNNVAMTDRVDAIGTREFVKKLKPKSVQMIELLFFRGCSTHDAAAALEIDAEAVKNQNRNCISELRNYLQV